MHRDLINEIAEEFTSELLCTGIDKYTLARMVERSINRAVETGSHMPIQEVWELAGGNPGLTPDGETVRSALEALKSTAGTDPTPLTYTAIKQAVLRVSKSHFSESGNGAEQHRNIVARQVAGEFTSVASVSQKAGPELLQAIIAYGDARAAGSTEATQALLTVEEALLSFGIDRDEPQIGKEDQTSFVVHGTTIELSEGRSVWLGKHNDSTLLHFRNGKLDTKLRISAQAAKALLYLLVESEYPDVEAEPATPDRLTEAG